MSLWPVNGRPAPVLLTSISRLSLGKELDAHVGVLNTTGTLGANNQARIAPFLLPEDVMVRKLFAGMGGASTGNFDMGIYDESYRKIVSSGSITHGAVNTIREFDITDFVLPRGRYYFALSGDTATGQAYNFMGFTDNARARSVGIATMETAFPLPDTFVPAASGGSGFFIMGIALRTLVN